MASTPEYFRMRESQCKQMAASASDPAVRRIHTDLAKRYAQQAAEAEAAGRGYQTVGNA